MCMLGRSGIEFPEADPEVPCCEGSAYGGPQGCTCWRPVHDRDQVKPNLGLPQIPVPVRMCEPDSAGDAGCAYRPHSPERDDADGYQGDATELDRMAATGQPFYCHTGMRRVVRYEHPAGLAVGSHPADYDPPIIDGVPYQADGSPAVVCAGWLLRSASFRSRVERVAKS